MSQENTPTGENEVIFDFNITTNEPRKARAFKMLCKIAFSNDEATQEETNEIMNYLPYVLRHQMNCWHYIWTPTDIQEYADEDKYDTKPTYEQAKRICFDLESYDNIVTEVNEAVKNELYTLSKNI